MVSFGQYLKHERETRGISLREISDTTRINLRYLEALEDDRLELIPRQFFVRAIIRSYVKAVGLDETQVLGKFDNKLEFGEQLEYKASSVEPAPPPPRFPSWARALVAALSVIAAGALVYFLILAPGKPAETPAAPPPETTRPAPVREAAADAQRAAETAVEAVPGPAETSTPAPNPPPAQPSPEPPPPPTAGLALEATFSADTWLRVRADGVQVFEGIKRPGETLSVKAEKTLVLSTGNAGAMNFTLNGRRAAPLGKPGAVVADVRMTPENYASFLASETAD